MKARRTTKVRMDESAPYKGPRTMKIALSFLLLTVPTLAFADLPSFIRDDLSSDVPGLASQTDLRLVSPWGLAASPQGPFWIAKEGTNLATQYTSSGILYPDAQNPSVVNLPNGPTGIVYNGSTSFLIEKDDREAPATFLFASENGMISGWSSQIDPTNAMILVDHSHEGAVYKGLALGSGSYANYVYVTNFYTGLIERYDERFNYVGSFADPCIPEGFAPFGIKNVGAYLVVTYAKQDEKKQSDVAGAGNGFVDLFAQDGSLIQRLATSDHLNSPWGIAVTGQTLLIGNVGDGHINMYDLNRGSYVGQLSDLHGKPLAIDGLRGLSFGNGYQGGQSDFIYFTAAIQNGAHGLFGQLRPFKYHPLIER
jgi:uncharacterized protein (TIGR03118 family)